MSKRRYKDIDMNFIPHPITGDISKKFDENDIKQSMLNLIKTDFYSRLDENIGADVRSALFALDTFVSKTYLESVLADVLEYEPRANVSEIIVNKSEGNKYRVRITFTTESIPTPVYLSTFLDLVN